MTLKVVLAQLQRMDARLDTLSDELCQVNSRVSRIARWQARLGGFVESPCHSLKAFEDEDDDGDSVDDDDDKGEDDSSSDLHHILIDIYKGEYKVRREVNRDVL